jgi:hypothetical protein
VSKVITIERSNARDLIEIPLYVGPAGGSAQAVTVTRIVAQLDTGNDHTAVRRSVLEESGVIVGPPQIMLQGVTGREIADSGRTTMLLHFDDGEECRIRDHIVVAANNLSCDALLGRDFLRWFDVHITRDGTVKLVM